MIDQTLDHDQFGDHKFILEIRDIFRGGEDAEIETHEKVSRGEVLGGGIPRLGGLEENHKLLQRGPGRSPGQKWVWCVLNSTERISDMQKRQNDQLHFDQLKHVVMLIRVRSWYRVRNSRQFSVPNDLVFFRERPSKFGTVPKNSGRMFTLGNYPCKPKPKPVCVALRRQVDSMR